MRYESAIGSPFQWSWIVDDIAADSDATGENNGDEEVVDKG